MKLLRSVLQQIKNNGVALPFLWFAEFLLNYLHRNLFCTTYEPTVWSNFHLDFKYGSAQNDGLLHSQNSDIYGDTSSSGDPTGGLYGGGKWGYSVNDTKTSGVTFVTGSVSVADY